MRINTLLKTIVAVGILAVAVNGQHASIKTADGYLHVFNGSPQSFTLEISGKSVEAQQAAGNPAFTIDGNLVQVLVVPRSNFDRDRKVKDDEILTAHQHWELDYLKKEVFEGELTASIESISLGERPALFWSFVRTKYRVEFDRDSFLTTRFADGIVGLSSPLKIGEDLKSGRDRLSKILKTARFAEKPFDIRKLADSIRKGLPVS
jgi:hypothetical protein